MATPGYRLVRPRPRPEPRGPALRVSRVKARAGRGEASRSRQHAGTNRGSGAAHSPVFNWSSGVRNRATRGLNRAVWTIEMSWPQSGKTRAGAQVRRVSRSPRISSICSSAERKSSAIFSAITSGSGRVSASSRLSSFSQKRSQTHSFRVHGSGEAGRRSIGRPGGLGPPRREVGQPACRAAQGRHEVDPGGPRDEPPECDLGSVGGPGRARDPRRRSRGAADRASPQLTSTARQHARP